MSNDRIYKIERLSTEIMNCVKFIEYLCNAIKEAFSPTHIKSL